MERKCILLLFPLLVLFSCTGSDVRHRLSEVESCIQSDPVLALEMLDSMDVRSLRGRRTRADFSLLYAMALDKNYIDTSDVDIAMPAVEYYDHHGPAAKSMKAWFYLGREQENGGEYQDAIISYTRAKEFAKKTDDLHFRALIASGVADLYRKTYNEKEHIVNMTEAYDLFLQAKDTLGYWIALGQLAASYTNEHQWEKADSLFNLFFAHEIVDSLRFPYYQLYYARKCIIQPSPNPAKAIDLIESAIIDYNSDLNVYNTGLYVYAYSLLGDMSRIGDYLTYLENNEATISEYDWKYDISKELGDYENALYALEDVFSQSLARAQGDYFEAKAELIAMDRKNRRVYNTIAILVLLMIVIVAIVLYSKRIGKMKLKISDVQSVVEQQRHELEEDKNAVNQLKTYYINKYRAQFGELDELCVEYWRSEHIGDKNHIYRKVQRLVSTITVESGACSEFEARINSGFDDVMKKLRSDFPEYKESDFRFISYIIAGFETKTISTIMDISFSSIYTKKSRMKEKIFASGSENVELYKMCLK
ncbi:MAG: hypothetical protein NC115_06085 [Bacteroidales bacterium]|nr:hypothetical protein [Bacteroidales bacterium]